METRNDNLPKDGGVPINFSVRGYGLDVLADPRVTFIAIFGLVPFQVVYAKTIQEKRDMLFQYLNILVAEPGAYRQDIFFLDDLDAARRELGFLLRSDCISYRDDDGRKWILEDRTEG